MVVGAMAYPRFVPPRVAAPRPHPALARAWAEVAAGHYPAAAATLDAFLQEPAAIESSAPTYRTLIRTQAVLYRWYDARPRRRLAVERYLDAGGDDAFAKRLRFILAPNVLRRKMGPAGAAFSGTPCVPDTLGPEVKLSVAEMWAVFGEVAKAQAALAAALRCRPESGAFLRRGAALLWSMNAPEKARAMEQLAAAAGAPGAGAGVHRLVHMHHRLYEVPEVALAEQRAGLTAVHQERVFHLDAVLRAAAMARRPAIATMLWADGLPCRDAGCREVEALLVRAHPGDGGAGPPPP